MFHFNPPAPTPHFKKTKQNKNINKTKKKQQQKKTKNKSTWKQNVFNLRYEDEVSLSKRVEFEDNVMIKLDLMRSFRQKP